MKLIEPTKDREKQIRAYRKEFLDCGYSVAPSERNKGYASQMLRKRIVFQGIY